MVWISDQDSEIEDTHPQASSSKAKITDGDKNPLADFAFDKLPTELLAEIFRHACPHDPKETFTREFLYPTALSHVCHHWRTVALGAPPLWANIRINKDYTEHTKEAACTYLERSKACPLFLTWVTTPGQTNSETQDVIDDLIIPCAERWQRITLIAGGGAVLDALLSIMGPLDFPILQDLEISSLLPQSPPSGLPLCNNAPLLRRCRLRNNFPLPPLPSNLVVLDCAARVDPLVEFLPHVAHSLEHLRFVPFASEVSATPHKLRIPLQNLKTLIVEVSHAILDYILAPNLTYFSASHPPEADARTVSEMFNDFSAPNLQSLRFHQTPLRPLLDSHSVPSIFPKLESVVLIDCINESDFVPFLEPPQPKKPSSLRKAQKYPSKHRKVDNPLPNLKELTISDMKNWTSFQGAIERRLKNDSKSLQKIHLPKGDLPDTIMRHITQWIPKQGIELVLYGPGELSTSAPPEFQDEFCNEEFGLFSDLMGGGWDDEEDDDYDYDNDNDYGDEYPSDFDDGLEYWQGRPMDRPDYELPHDRFYEYLDDFDDEENEEEEYVEENFDQD